MVDKLDWSLVFVPFIVCHDDCGIGQFFSYSCQGEVRGVKVVESDQMYNFYRKLYVQGMLSQKSLQNM